MTELDPTRLYRVRDSVYAPDLLVVAVVELDLFSWLHARGQASVGELCGHFELRERPVDVLATYCAALGLLTRDGDRFGVTELAARHLVAGSRYDLRAYYASLAERPACAELGGVLRTDQPAAWASARKPDGAGERDWSGRLGDVGFARRITAAMDARGAFLGPALAGALADLRFERALDVGGSSGVYLCALLDARSGARGAVFERPPIDIAARTLLTGRGYAGRVEVHSGDMFTDPLPADHDLHLYSHVLHDWEESRVRALLRSSYAALPPGGWLVDHDAHVDADKCGPLPVAEYSVLLMHSTPGKCWSVAELGTMLTETGFTDVEQRPTAGDRSVVLARKPDIG
jgi:3-hydroxy-5-methyl-1-naphthoate 3-O-methyltransferase